MKSFSLVFMSLFGMGWISNAQDSEPSNLALPECDIFLFDLVETQEKMRISAGRNITKRAGYDNQPWFTPQSQSLLFSANYSPDRTDIFEYFIESGEIRQVTDTPTQEYSPQVSPDNQTLSFVTDGKTANQSVWSMSRESTQESWLLEHLGEREPVGYYSWNHRNGYILFWSRYGFSLRLVHENKAISHYVTGNAVPSTPCIIPGTDHFSFLHQQGNAERWIKELNPVTLAVRPLARAMGNQPHYAWSPKGYLVMTDGSTLYRCAPDQQSRWEPVTDLSEHGAMSGTRVAFSPDGAYFALVALPLEKNSDGDDD